MATIQEIHDALGEWAQNTVVAAGAQHFANYRTLSKQVSPLVMLTNTGNAPGEGTVGDRGRTCDFTLVIAARYETDDLDSQELAEQQLNTIEDAVWSDYETWQSQHWSLITMARASTRPSSPMEYAGWRWAEIYLRVKGR